MKKRVGADGLDDGVPAAKDALVVLSHPAGGVLVTSAKGGDPTLPTAKAAPLAAPAPVPTAIAAPAAGPGTPLDHLRHLRPADPDVASLVQATGAAKGALSFAAASAIAVANAESGPIAKLDDQLAALFYQHSPMARQMSAFTATVQQFKGAVSPDGELVVLDVLAANGDGAALLKDLQAIGLQSGSSYGAMAGGVLPTSALDALIGLSSVQSAHESGLIHHVGRVTSQSDHALASDAARLNTTLTGAGLKIGVLSDSFNTDTGAVAPNPTAGGAAIRDDMAYDITNDDLPAATTILQDYTSNSALDEGRAMAQIIHDIAPGASIQFATADISETGFASNIRALANAGANIIVDDVTYFDEPVFQNGIVSQAVNAVAAQGVAYFSSAGNSGEGWFGNIGYESATTATPINEALTLVTFGSKNYLPMTNIDKLTAGASYSGAYLTVSWDEPDKAAGNGSPGPATNLDFYVVDLTTNTVKARSTTNNVTSGIPNNTISFSQVGGHAYGLYVGVRTPTGQTFNPNTAPKHLQIVVSNLDYTFGDAGTNTARIDSRSVSGHNGAAGAVSVGAAYYADTPAYGTTPAVAEAYSSQGNVTLYYNDQGQRLATPQVLNKVDVTATDGADTSFFLYKYNGPSDTEDYDNSGYPDFFGTSAAAPAAAAISALMLQARPALNPTDIVNLLKDSALDMSTPGFDRVSGAGLVQADRAVSFAQSLSIQNTDQSTLYGTHLNDIIRGSAVADTLLGFDGNDRIDGGAGDDRIEGGPGADIIIGGAGGDQLYGGAGADVFFYQRTTDSPNNANDDINDFEPGVDRVDVSAVDRGYVHVDYTSDGQSFLYFDSDGAGGWREVVQVHGRVSGGDLAVSAGTNINLIAPTDGSVQDITGGAGDDRIFAGSGGGILNGLGGSDVYALGAGSDRVVFSSAADSPNGAPDIVYGFTSGQDVIDVSAISGEIDLGYTPDGDTYLSFGGYAGQIIIHGIVKPNDIGTAAAPLIVEQGGSTPGSLYGGGGGGSEVRLFAGSAGDTLYAGSGPTTMVGGAGADRFVFSDTTQSPSAQPDVVFGFVSGQDKLDFSSVFGEVDLGFAADGKSYIRFGDYAGQVIVNDVQVTPGDIIAPSGSPIVVFGGGAGATLYGGGSGEVRLFASDAGNTLVSGTGNEVMRGGAGADTFLFGSTAESSTARPDVIYDFQHGLDRLNVAAADAGQVTIRLNAGGETVVDFGGVSGAAATGRIYVHGLLGADDLVASAAGRNVSFEVVAPGQTALGGGGADTFDVLGAGSTLTGGGGADLFTFSVLGASAPAAPARITDFDPTAGDKIALDQIDANPATSADDAFHLVASFTGQAGEATLVYDAARDLTSFSADTRGDGVADFVLQLSGRHDSAAGFVF